MESRLRPVCLKKDLSKSGRYSFTQFVQISRRVVGQSIVGPYVVHWVQFWRVWREHLHNQPSMSSEVIGDRLCTVNQDSIPQERDGSPNLVAHKFDKLHHRLPVEVGVICRELKVKTEVPPLRADCDCPDHRDASVGLRDFNYVRKFFGGRTDLFLFQNIFRALRATKPSRGVL